MAKDAVGSTLHGNKQPAKVGTWRQEDVSEIKSPERTRTSILATTRDCPTAAGLRRTSSAVPAGRRTANSPKRSALHIPVWKANASGATLQPSTLGALTRPARSPVAARTIQRRRAPSSAPPLQQHIRQPKGIQPSGRLGRQKAALSGGRPRPAPRTDAAVAAPRRPGVGLVEVVAFCEELHAQLELPAGHLVAAGPTSSAENEAVVGVAPTLEELAWPSTAPAGAQLALSATTASLVLRPTSGAVGSEEGTRCPPPSAADSGVLHHFLQAADENVSTGAQDGADTECRPAVATIDSGGPSRDEKGTKEDLQASSVAGPELAMVNPAPASKAAPGRPGQPMLGSTPSAMIARPVSKQPQTAAAATEPGMPPDTLSAPDVPAVHSRRASDGGGKKALGRLSGSLPFTQRLSKTQSLSTPQIVDAGVVITKELPPIKTARPSATPAHQTQLQRGRKFLCIPLACFRRA